MSIVLSLLPEFDREMATLRKVLARVPMDKGSFQPHPTSMTMQALCAHIVNMIYWAVPTIQQPFVDIAGVVRPPIPEDSETMLMQFDANVAATREALAGCSDADFLAEWSLRAGEKTMFSMPRIVALRSMIFNHLIHHRGQLSVYLRMNGVPVPAIYGPSGDES